MPSELFSIVNGSNVIPTVKSFVVNFTGAIPAVYGFKTTAGSTIDPTFYQVAI